MYFGSQSSRIRIWQVKSQVICLFAYAKIVLIAFQALAGSHHRPFKSILISAHSLGLISCTTTDHHYWLPSTIVHYPFVIIPWHLIFIFMLLHFLLIQLLFSLNIQTY